MRSLLLSTISALGLLLLVTGAISQNVQNAPPPAPSPEQRAAATRVFLGLGAEPDKAAAARGAPLFQQNCAFCHGPQARGAEGPSLITSDVVLGDDHGEHLVPFLKSGRPEKGMPAFAGVPDDQLKDIAEFLHLQVEDVANRGAYHVLNILVGDAAQGKAYFAANCVSCHSVAAFAHIASKYRSPDQLQRGWVWPARPADNSLAITATVKTADSATISGRVAQVSDFRITLVDADGHTHVIERGTGVDVRMKDPLAPHQTMIMTLKNEDMHNVTAYLETLK
jgi:cytochrome c oxidase cbb3-type subunit III